MDALRKKPPKLFVCLSGGGFRASLFQLGALKRLHEAGVLPHVVAVSATSGGSYVAACLALFPFGIKYDDGGKPEHLLVPWDKIEAMVLHFARNGVLRPTAILIGALVSYALAAMAAVIAYAGIVAFAPVAVGILVFGLAGHIGLFVYLRGATRLHLDQFDQHEGTAHNRPAAGARLLRMLLSPAYLRCQTLNFMGFDGRPLSLLPDSPKIYVTVVDLNDGREKVFTQSGVLAALDGQGTRALWEQRNKEGTNNAKNVEVAEIVAASSAIPPLFKPVTLGGLGTFVDGGITDNLAMNVPKAFATEINKARPRYGDGSPLRPFAEKVDLLLVIDGSKPIEIMPESTRWTQLSFRRVLDAISHQAILDAENATLNFQRHVNIPSGILALRNGFIDKDNELPSDVRAVLNDSICRVRTHLDGFSPEECAVLMHCGYLQAELFLNDRTDLQQHSSYQDAPLRGVTDMLPAPSSAISDDWAFLASHMRASETLWSPLRAARRFFNI